MDRLPTHQYWSACGQLAGVPVLLFGFLVFRLFLNSDVPKLGGIKDLSAGLALNEFSIFVTGDDLYDGVFAVCGRHGEVWGWDGWILPVGKLVVNPRLALSHRGNPACGGYQRDVHYLRPELS